MYIKLFSYFAMFGIGSGLMYYYKEKQIQEIKIASLERAKLIQQNVITVNDKSHAQYKMRMQQIDNTPVDLKNNIEMYLKHINELYEKYQVNNL